MCLLEELSPVVNIDDEDENEDKANAASSSNTTTNTTTKTTAATGASNSTTKAKIFILPCHRSHIICSVCLSEWLKVHNNCPLCRATIPRTWYINNNLMPSPSSPPYPFSASHMRERFVLVGARGRRGGRRRRRGESFIADPTSLMIQQMMSHRDEFGHVTRANCCMM